MCLLSLTHLYIYLYFKTTDSKLKIYTPHCHDLLSHNPIIEVKFGEQIATFSNSTPRRNYHEFDVHRPNEEVQCIFNSKTPQVINDEFLQAQL